MALVVHPHFHRRRTGVTRHVEAIVTELSRSLQTRAIGGALDRRVPRIGWRELLRRSRDEELIWHAHRNHELLFGLLLRAVGRKVRVVFTRHSSTGPSRWTRFLAARADQVVTLTRPMAVVLGMPSAIVTHGVELPRFAPPASRAEAWRALGLSGERGIGVIGRLRPSKGQGDFVEAVAPLLREHPQWRAVLVGPVKPPERRFVEELRRRGGEQLSVIGEQRDVARWYRGLTVLVHPSWSEGYSLVLVEAMAAGCCVVASRLPHVPDVVEHGRTGFLYPPGDVAALRAALAELLAQPGEAERVGRRAAEEAQRRFGIEHEAAALSRIYEPYLSR